VGMLRRMKDMKDMVNAAPGMVAQAQQMAAAQQAAMQAQLAQAGGMQAGGMQAGAAPVGPDFAPHRRRLAGSVRRYQQGDHGVQLRPVEDAADCGIKGDPGVRLGERGAGVE
jgi:hypothetical protein